jgi:quinol monooxygenase YgiN
MSLPTNVVSIHPYFKVHAGQLDAFKALMRAFVEKTKPEAGNLYYEFTVNGDEVFCREGYIGAEGALAHLTNVGELVAEALKISTLLRLELHGPADELEKMKGPMAALNPAMFALECAARR